MSETVWIASITFDTISTFHCNLLNDHKVRPILRAESPSGQSWISMPPLFLCPPRWPWLLLSPLYPLTFVRPSDHGSFYKKYLSPLYLVYVCPPLWPWLLLKQIYISLLWPKRNIWHCHGCPPKLSKMCLLLFLIQRQNMFAGHPTFASIDNTTFVTCQFQMWGILYMYWRLAMFLSSFSPDAKPLHPDSLLMCSVRGKKLSTWRGKRWEWYDQPMLWKESAHVVDGWDNCRLLAHTDTIPLVLLVPQKFNNPAIKRL